MSKSIVVSNANELVRLPAERVVYICSVGNSSTMILHDKSELVFNTNLASWMKLLEQQLGAEANTFIRIGKQHIINKKYIFKINLNKQQLLLADMALSHTFKIEASRGALKQLKELLESELNEWEILS